jgi:hypothetical protein
VASPNEEIEHSVSVPTVEVEVAAAGDEVDELPGLDSPEQPEPAASTAARALWSFGIDVRYKFEGGKSVAPRAAPNGSPLAVWRAHGGYWKMLVVWEAASINERPKVPHPEEMCPNEHLLDGEIAHGDPKPAVSGGLIYRALGWYGYALRYAPYEADPLAGATSPVYEGSLPAASNTIMVADFDRTLLSRVNPGRFVATPGEENLNAAATG